MGSDASPKSISYKKCMGRIDFETDLDQIKTLMQGEVDGEYSLQHFIKKFKSCRGYSKDIFHKHIDTCQKRFRGVFNDIEKLTLEDLKLVRTFAYFDANQERI